MIHRVIYNADDSVIVMSPSLDGRLNKETEIEHIERNYQDYMTTHPQYSGLDYEDLDTSVLPPDRTNRDKWRKKAGGGVKIDHTVITSSELRMADKVALQAERDKSVPNMKVALDLLLKLQDNKY